MQPELSIDQNAFFCGEALPAKLRLVNTGAAEAQADVGQGAPIRYEFLNPEGKVVRTVSRAEMFARRNAGSPHGPAEPRIRSAAAGQSIETKDDLCMLGRGFIAPGNYSVRAVWGSGDKETRSAGVQVRIEPLEARMCVSVFSPYRDGFSFLASHRGALVERNTLGFFVTEGVFRRMPGEIEAAQPEFAISVDLAPKLPGNKRVWMNQGELTATGGSVATGLGDAALLNPGFQTDEKQALFAVAGTNGTQHAVRLFRLEGNALSAAGAPVPCGKAKMMRACVANPPDVEESLMIVWAEEQGETTRVVSQRISLDGKALGEAKVLLEKSWKLLSLSVEAVMIDAPGWVHTLWGPFGPDPEHLKVEYTLSALTGAAATQKFEIPVPEDGTVTEWAIGGGLEMYPVVVAALSTGHVVYANGAKFTDWENLASQQPGAHSLAVLKAPKFRYWAASWLDPKSGLRYAPDPEYH